MTTASIDKILLMAGTWTAIGSAVLFIAWLATKLFKRNAAIRHLAWLSAFSVLLLIPIFTAMAPTALNLKIPIKLVEPRVTLETSRLTAQSTFTKPPVEPNNRSAPDQSPESLLLLAWASGLLLVTIQAAYALSGVRQIRKNSVEEGEQSSMLKSLAAQLNIGRRLSLRVSNAQKPPAAMTWGIVRPVVLLPKSSKSWPEARREAVLLHELAHVRRFDAFSQLLSVIVCALYWFNPAVWICARAMRSEAEIAADDAVLKSGIRPTDYAAELLRLATELGHRKQPLTAIGVSFMKRSGIESRVKSIVDPANSRTGPTPTQYASIAACGLIAAFLLATIKPSIDLKQKQADALVDELVYSLRKHNIQLHDKQLMKKLLASQSQKSPTSNQAVRLMAMKQKREQELLAASSNDWVPSSAPLPQAKHLIQPASARTEPPAEPASPLRSASLIDNTSSKIRGAQVIANRESDRKYISKLEHVVVPVHKSLPIQVRTLVSQPSPNIVAMVPSPDADPDDIKDQADDAAELAREKMRDASQQLQQALQHQLRLKDHARGDGDDPAEVTQEKLEEAAKRVQDAVQNQARLQQELIAQNAERWKVKMGRSDLGWTRPPSSIKGRRPLGPPK